MNKKEALDLLKRGQSRIWNKYRKDNPNWKPDLEGEDLSQINFVPKDKQVFDLKNANLVGCKLPGLSRLIPSGIQIGYSAKDSRGTVHFQSNSGLADVLENSDMTIPFSKIAKVLGSRSGITHHSDNVSNLFSDHLSGVLIDQKTSITPGGR